MALGQSALESIGETYVGSMYSEYDEGSNVTERVRLLRTGAAASLRHIEDLEMSYNKRNAVYKLKEDYTRELVESLRKFEESGCPFSCPNDEVIHVKVYSGVPMPVNVCFYLLSGELQVSRLDGIEAVPGTVRGRLLHSGVIVPITQMIEKGQLHAALQLVMKAIQKEGV